MNGIKKSVRANKALKILQDLLREGDYQIGSRLPAERELAVALGLSRSALREGLALLEAEGLIWRHVGQGTFVGARAANDKKSLSLISEFTNPMEVMEVRIALEPHLAALAAIRATPAEIAHMERCVQKSETAPNAQTYELWDGTLHRVLAGATHNTLMIAVFNAINEIRTQTAWGRLRGSVFTPARRSEYCRQHEAFVDAIAERDAERAEMMMRDHLESVQRNLLTVNRSRGLQKATEEMISYDES